MFSQEKFTKIVHHGNWDYFKAYNECLEEVMNSFEINTPLRKAHFLAQVCHESGGFKHVVENLNYSNTGLNKVFKKYFPTLSSAASFHRQPEKIANKVYANRMGNGTEASGDGWKYKGRGLIQLTGKTNYQNFSTATGQDFVAKPEMVAEPKWALTSACWFWKSRNLNKYADLDDVKTVTKLINGGFNGLEDRTLLLGQFKKLYADLAANPVAAPATPTEPTTPPATPTT